MKKRSKPMFYGAEIIASLIYLCALSAGMMYVLCRDYAFICTVIMTALSCGIYMIFYKLRRRRGFSLLAFVAMFLIVNVVCSIVGSPYRSPSFLEFIFRASDFFDPVYAGASIVLFSLIVAFPTCYFTAYLPRPCFLLLPSFVPLILAARLTGGFPLGLMVFLAVGYMLAAAGIARPEFPADHAYVDDKSAHVERIIAMGTAGVVAAVLLVIVPRSDHTPMLRYLDTITQRTSAYGRNMLTDFTESSRPNRGNNTLSDDALFLVYAAYPRNVSRWSFDVYNGSDGWTFNSDFSTGQDDWESRRRKVNINKLIADLKAGVKEGKLEAYKDELDKIDDIPENMYSAARMTIRVVDGSTTSVVLHPSETIGVSFVLESGEPPVAYRNPKDEIFTEKRAMPRNPIYVVDYYYTAPGEKFMDMLERVNFRFMLNDAVKEGVIDSAVRDEIALESESAELYYMAGLDSSLTPEIKALAEEITAGLTNNYEKALAIEKWFGDAGFVYDLSFVPERAEADYFMFESRRGICTDFATASTLLLRAAGIPARYTEGFVLREDALDSYGRYVVTAAHAHAYSTAYIEGYGWLEIDGTKYAPVSSLDDRIAFAVTVIIIPTVILGVLAIIFRRQLSELIFAISYGLKGKSGKIRAVYLRTRGLACRIAGIEPKSATAEEVRDILSRTLSLDGEAAEITGAADELFYGGGSADVDTKRLYNDYRTIYRMKRSRKK